ncbi:hypothetical protein [Microbacterium sp.]|uniref:hypothetical protein n=1 Tax=Microbacterium sp. TaxID=51671 RepID=UPI0037CC72EA
MHRIAALLTVLAVAALTLVACSFGGQSCVHRLDIAPQSAAPGSMVTVSTVDECDAEVPEGGWVLLLAPAGSPEQGVRTTVQATTGEGFTAELMVPVDMPIGEAFVAIDNWDYADCEDPGATCASASGDFVVEQYEGQGRSQLLTRCLPGEIAVETASVSAGERIVVTGAPGDCREASEAMDLSSVVYRLALYDRTLTELASVDAPLAADGALRAELVVPAGTPAGAVLVEVVNFFELVPCAPGADCADVTVRLQVTD